MKGYNERVLEANNKLHQLLSVKKYYDYFIKCPEYRGDYLVEMRRYYVCKLLQETNLNKSEIADIFGKEHSTIIAITKQLENTVIDSYTETDYEKWIAMELYPCSVQETVPCAFSKTGTTARTVMKLIKPKKVWLRREDRCNWKQL